MNRTFYFLCLVCIFLCSCVHKDKSEIKPLKIFSTYRTAFMPMILADKLGYFKDEGIKVEYVFTHNSSNLLMEFEAGAYDGAFLVFSSLLTSRQYGDFKVALATDFSASADAIVSFPNIKSIKEIKGKKVASVSGGYGEMSVVSMLHQNNLRPTDISWVQIGDENDGVKQFLEKKVDAIHLWEPYLTKLKKAGAKTLFDSQSVPGLVIGTLAIRKKTLDERKNELKGFFRAWFKAVDYWKKNPDEAQRIIAQRLNIPSDEVNLKGFEFVDLRDNAKAMLLGSDYTSLFYCGDMINNYLYEKNFIHKKNDIAEMIDTSLIDELK